MIARRLLIEYAFLLAVVAVGTVLGSQHPVIVGHGTEPARQMFSISWLFSGNAAIVLVMLLCSVFTGGIVGVVVLFTNALLYGSLISIYNHDSLWSAVFPWLEIFALIIAVQIGADVFWSLLLRWRIHLKLTLALLSTSILLLVVAAFIEGGILHV